MLALDAQSFVIRFSSFAKMVRLPGIAPGPAPWRGAILLLNHNREVSIAAMPRRTHAQTNLREISEKLSPRQLVALFAATLLLLTSCGLGPEQISLSDPKIQPLLKAMTEVDRSALGFTPVTTNAQIKLELASGRTHDAMLHVYGDTSRTIAFRKIESGYRWIFEQETYKGPKWYQTVDGTFRESMLIEYQTERIDGVPTNQLHIRYTGSDTNLTDRELMLADVRPILEKWSTAPVEPWPGYIQGAPDFAPLLFGLFMLGALLVGCIGRMTKIFDSVETGFFGDKVSS